MKSTLTLRGTLVCTALAASTLLSACVVAPLPPPRPPRPAPVVEVIPVQPGPGYHWVRGHHEWEGNHWGWIRGHWAPNY